MSTTRTIYTPGAGLPLGVPTDAIDDAVRAQVSGEIPSSGTPNTSAPSSSEVAPRGAGGRVGARQLARLAHHLSDRDRDVLQMIADHRYLTTHQIRQFCFLDHETAATGARVARRVLSRLGRDGLIRPLDRRVGGFGSGSAVTIWRLNAPGNELTPAIHELHDAAREFSRWRNSSLGVPSTEPVDTADLGENQKLPGESREFGLNHRFRLADIFRVGSSKNVLVPSVRLELTLYGF